MVLYGQNRMNRTPPADREAATAGLESLETRRLLDVGLIGHFRLDDAAGAFADNAAGGERGVVEGGAADGWTAGKYVGGLRLDGVDDRVSVPNNGVYDGEQFTVAMWMNGGRYQVGDGFLAVGGNAGLWRLDSGTGDSVRFQIDLNDGQPPRSWQSAGGLSKDQWHHVAVSYDGRTLRFHIDGGLDAEHVADLNIDANDGPLVIGAARDRHFQGVLDDVRFYNRPLSDLEIASLAAEPGVAGKFRLGDRAFTVGERAGLARVPIYRIGGTLGAATVDYSVTSFTATEGEDYAGVGGQVTFGDGDVRADVLIPIYDDTLAEGDETLSVALDRVQGPGGLDAPRTATLTITDEPADPDAGDGLTGTYFRNRDFTGEVFSRVDPFVDFQWRDNAADGRLPADGFSVRWQGQIRADFTGDHTFTLSADDGVRLWVGGKLVIDQPEWTPADEYAGTARLVAGQKTDIKLEFNEGTGWASVKLQWEGPGTPKQVVPRRALFSDFTPPPAAGDGDGLRGLYYRDRQHGDLAFERVDPKIDFEYRDGSPDARLPADGFGVRWIGEIVPLYGETYTFHAVADDGVTLKIDGQTLVSQFDWTSAQEYVGTIDLVAGERVPIKFAFNEGTGWASAKLFWSSPSQPKQIVPQSQLFSVEAPEPPASGTGDGLTGTYFGSDDFTGETFARTDATIDFQWQDGSPRADIGDDFFSVRWAGEIETRYSETYTFHIEADDAFRLFIDGEVVADVPSWTPAAEYTGTIDLVAGERVPIELSFVERTGWAGVKLSWSSASQPKQVVPQSQLYSGTVRPPAIVGDGTGLLAEYFDNADFTDKKLTRIDPAIDFDWQDRGSVAGVGADTFAVRWTGQIQAQHTELYRFQTTTDDGVRVWIDGDLVINQWQNQPGTAVTSAQLALEAGRKYDLRVEYYENTGNALARLMWSSPSTPMQVVPKSQLYPADVAPPPTAGSFGVETVVDGLVQPTYVDFAPSGWMFVALKDGRILLNIDGRQSVFADLRDDVNDTRDRGLLSIAVHPEFPEKPYVYAAYTYDPPEAAGGTGLARRDDMGNRPARLVRVRATEASGFTAVEPGGGEVILGKNSTWQNINRPDLDSTGRSNEHLAPSGLNENGEWIDDYVNTDSQSHSIGAVKFGLDGNLYVTIGDGTSYGFTDRRTARVQDVDSLSGKLLRLDPDTGEGLPDNPFHNGDPNANRSKVFALGLRNPFRTAIHPTTGDVFIGDVGWGRFEEINTIDDAGGGGTNFGWPWFEGMEGQPRPTGGYRDLPEAQEFYANGPATTPPLLARDHHDGGVAVAVGDFYDGTLHRYPARYENALFWADYGLGRVEILELNDDGTVRRNEPVTGNIGRPVAMAQSPTDGYLYVVDLNGRIVRLTFA